MNHSVRKQQDEISEMRVFCFDLCASESIRTLIIFRIYRTNPPVPPLQGRRDSADGCLRTPSPLFTQEAPETHEV